MEPRRNFGGAMRDLLVSEAAGGIILICAAGLAITLANSGAADLYFKTLQVRLGSLSLLEWINDGLMALFFLLVGLEIKREVFDGELASWRRRALPGLGALGGMAVPAAIYLAFNRSGQGYPEGWAIPAATDIAFALGVLALLGKSVPISLKIFLAALAIVDDLGAVLVIALFYTAEISPLMLGLAAATVLVLIILNRLGVRSLWIYLALGLPLWVFTLKSGVHATIAGVVLALCVPMDIGVGMEHENHSPLHRLEHALTRWIAFLVVPVFGFANAGVSLGGVTLESLTHPVTLGVAAGLFLGKQIGVFGFAYAAIALKIAQKPSGSSFAQLYGVSLLCGIGFTMSLFVGMLAFPNSQSSVDATKIGVLLGSVASALAGAVVLILSRPSHPINHERAALNS